MQDAGRRILILDDEADRLQPLQTLLQAREWNVTLLSDSETAFALLESAPADIVLVDYHMAGSSGMHFVEKARLAYPRCRFIMMSGAPDESVQEFCHASGIQLITKPFRSTDLLRILGQ